MSDRDLGFGPFVIGIAVGVTLGLLFAREDGTVFRSKVAGRLRTLRERAIERAGDIGALVLNAATPEGDDDRPTGSRRTGRRGRSSGEEDVSIV